MSRINSKTARGRLQVRREPYWYRLRKGLYVGFRQLSEGEGTWNGKFTDPATSKRIYTTLGTIAADGKVDSFDIASKRILKWAAEVDRGVSVKGETVADGCRLYVADLRIRSGSAAAADAEGRFARLVYAAPIGAIAFPKLRDIDVTTWRNDQVPTAATADATRRAKDSANRNLASFKASLNFCRRKKLVASDDAWRDVVPFTKVGKRRTAFLSVAERKRLLKAAAPDLRTLCVALLWTGARPGELANASVADFDRKAGLLTLSGKTGTRQVTVATAARELFAAAVRGRVGALPLLARVNGQPWNRFAWRESFRAAADIARLPKSITLYSLRHAAISEMVLAGMNTSVVAQLTGTSTAMIDAHYGKFQQDRTAAALDRVPMLG